MAALVLFAALCLEIATMLSLIDPLNVFVWITLGITAIGGLFWQAIAPQRELEELRKNIPEIIIDDFIIYPKKFWTETYYLCPGINVRAEIANATRVHAEVRWTLLGSHETNLNINHGFWEIPDKDLSTSSIDNQTVDLYANGMTRTFYFARKGSIKSLLETWERIGDEIRFWCLSRKVEERYRVDITFRSSNHGKTSVSFLLINNESELIMERLDNGQKKYGVF